MKTALITLAAVALVSAAPGAQGAATKALAPLQGTWTITSINGQDPAASGTTMTITFTDDKYTQTVNGTVNERGTVKLGTDKKFTTIDLAITEGDDANKLQVGLRGSERIDDEAQARAARPDHAADGLCGERGRNPRAVDEKCEGLRKNEGTEKKRA